MESRTFLQSLKTLVDPKTIPFLVAQGVPRKLLPLGTFLLGMAIAFLWAYMVSPNVYTGAEPVNLSDSWKSEYVKQVAWQYSAAKTDPTLAAIAEDNARKQLATIGNSPTVVDALLLDLQQNNPADPLIARLMEIKPLTADSPDQIGKITPSLTNSNITPLLCIFAIGLLGTIIIIFNTLIPIGLLFQRKSSAPSTVVAGVEEERRKAQQAAKKMAETAAAAAPTSVATVNLGAPVGRYVSSYIMGDEYYDDSFSIEKPTGEFLGETGAGITKTIGVGDPKKVTATEVWVFDKVSTRTMTRVLMSEHAFNDEAIRAELAPKGEAVMIKPGETVIIESQSLTLQARVLNLVYGTGALPPNSYFEQLSIEISAWERKDGPAPMAPAFGETGPVN
jgi:hypothetical protein